MAGRLEAARRAWRSMFEPKLLTVLREGYGLQTFKADAIAGLTVAIVALPLAMALAIASGTTPEKGLHTAIIAGFLISVFGGSRVQIGGPTAAFIPVVFVVIQKFGYGGLILCTLMAGLMLIGAGLLRLGTLMKYMPQPVITGFTAGIAVSIFSSQVKDVLGLRMDAGSEEDVVRAVALACERFGRLDVLINNAGAAQSGAFVEQSADSVTRIITLNTLALARLASAATARRKAWVVDCRREKV